MAKNLSCFQKNTPDENFLNRGYLKAPHFNAGKIFIAEFFQIRRRLPAC